MRKILVVCLTCLAFTLAAQQKNTSTTMDFKEAIQQKLLSADVKGLGGHHGEKLVIVCKNLKGRTFQVRIPQGLLMEPTDTTEQTLVVAEEMVFSLNAKSPLEIKLKTFCTQAGEASPNIGSPFTAGALAPKMVCDLLKFIQDNKKGDAQTAQAAVWCLTSGRSLGAIGDTGLAQFVANQMGKELPGYKIKYKTVEQVPGRLADLGEALVIEGNFIYYLEKDVKAMLVLLDEHEKFIKQISKEELLIAGEHRSGIKVEVWNLPKGKYILRMKTKGGRTIKDMNVEF